MQSIQISNNAVLTGKISNDFAFSHLVLDQKFYTFLLSVPRLSGALDKINITAPQSLIENTNIKTEDIIQVTGQFRSYNNPSGNGSRLVLSVFAKNIEQIKTPSYKSDYVNEISLSGYICKPPIYRTTPFGREITDLLLAVNRAYGKSDYIPCIAWGRNAKYSKALEVGDKINIEGRIQSREYQKKINENKQITKTAFEVSISKII